MELLRHLTHEMTELIRKEVELAKAETTEKISQARSGLTSVAAGGAVAFAGFLGLLAAAVLFIDQWIQEPWLSALIIAGAVLVIGLAMLAKGRKDLKAGELAPRKTAESLRRDKDMLKHEIRGTT
jgi:predicted phage tail protein